MEAVAAHIGSAGTGVAGILTFGTTAHEQIGIPFGPTEAGTTGGGGGSHGMRSRAILAGHGGGSFSRQTRRSHGMGIKMFVGATA